MKVFIIEKGFSLMESPQKNAERVLRRAGWKVRSRTDGGLDMERKGLRFTAHLSSAPQSYASLLEAYLARAWLEAQADAMEAEKAKPLALLLAPSISPGLLRKLERYMSRVAPGAHWAVSDAAGRMELRGPSFKDGGEWIPAASPSPPNRSPASAPRRFSLFSDLHQWLLKVLLADHFPPAQLAAPRGPFRNSSTLADAAGVSQPSVSRLLALLDHNGFLDREKGHLRIVKASQLLEQWRAATWKPAREFGARVLLSSGGLDAFRITVSLANRQFSKPGQRVSLGLFAACDELGLKRAKGVPIHLYVENPSLRALEDLGLVPSQAGEHPDVWVRVPEWPETVFRGAVSLESGAAATDVLQCWLDVSHEPTRGAEQAEYLWRRAIAPALEGID